MKLNCPYCGETIPYDRSLAGRSMSCSYCEHAIKMPAVEELPQESQEELRREEAKQEEKQKRKYLRKQDRYLKEIEKEERLKREREAREKQEESQKEAEAAQEPVPEELAVRKRYRALRALARWNKLLAGLNLLGYVAYVLVHAVLASRGSTPWSWVLVGALLLAVPTAFMTLIAWMSGELMQVFLDIADDVRITRLLAKRQTYRKTD